MAVGQLRNPRHRAGSKRLDAPRRQAEQQSGRAGVAVRQVRRAGQDHARRLHYFKRGMIGTYQHCGEQHLQRYLAEFDFRYNHRKAVGRDDMQRTLDVLKGIGGKRLTYRRLS